MKLTVPKLGVVKKVGAKIVKVGGPRVAKLAFAAKKDAPVILLAVGGAMIVGGTVYACVKTVGVDEEVSEHMDTINLNKEAIKDPGNKDDIPEIKSVIREEWVKTGFDLGKCYAIPAIMITGGLVCVIAARNIEHTRFVMAMASVESITAAFEAYRLRVIEDQGLSADKRYMEGTYDAQVDFYGEQPQDKRKKPKKETENVIGGKKPGSPYAVIFSPETTDCWSNDRSENKYFLDTTNVYLNQKLNEEGYLFLNEVYKALGMGYEPIGQFAGWLVPTNEEDAMLRDGEVHIIVTEMYLEEEIERSRREHTNPCPTLRLDFNVDGIIWDKVQDKVQEKKKEE